MSGGVYDKIQQETTLEGYESVVDEFSTLVSTYPPPFIYIHDPTAPRISASVIGSCLSDAANDDSIRVLYAHVDAVVCFTPRLLYDTVINAFASYTPEWDDGCSNWAGPSDWEGLRDTASFDGFLHTLRTLWKTKSPHTNGRNEATAASVTTDTRFVIFIQRAEKLKDTMQDILVPLTRLAELVGTRASIEPCGTFQGAGLPLTLRPTCPSQTTLIDYILSLEQARLDITVVMHSNVRWELIRPSMGASLDPYYLDVPPLSRKATLARLSSLYPSLPSLPQSSGLDPNTYHPNLRSLYDHFLETLYSICSVYTKDPDELAYIAAARWPGFVQPVLDEHRQRHRRQECETSDAGGDEDMDLDAAGVEEAEIAPPNDHTRARLAKLFNNSISRALEHLYPRRTSALAWTCANAPPPNLLSIPPREMVSVAARLPEEANRSEAPLKELPRMAKFVLVAAFLTSTNPAKTDMRMFGRGRDERKKRRKRGGSPRKMSAKNAAAKVPQRLLGPMPFPLDRMIAILGVLLEENDADTRPPAPEYEIPGEYTEMEISRVAVYAQVMELTSMHLLHRTSPADRLGMSPVFKCGIAYDAAMSLARDVGIVLNDLMWEPA